VHLRIGGPLSSKLQAAGVQDFPEDFIKEE
jgi:hypothetical protein